MENRSIEWSLRNKPQQVVEISYVTSEDGFVYFRGAIARGTRIIVQTSFAKLSWRKINRHVLVRERVVDASVYIPLNVGLSPLEQQPVSFALCRSGVYSVQFPTRLQYFFPLPNLLFSPPPLQFHGNFFVNNKCECNVNR